MNWLAHIFLSQNHIEYQHGNLLADLLKGRGWDSASNSFLAGLTMHRSIDRFTDSNPHVAQSKSRLCTSGYLKGVVVDITYDHLLVKNWHRYSRIAFDHFVDGFHHRSRAVLHNYPETPQRFLIRLIETEHLMDYASLVGIEKAFRRVDSRLSSRVLAKERTLDYLPRVEAEIREIEQDFLAFMPEIIRHFKSVSDVRADSHWLK